MAWRSPGFLRLMEVDNCETHSSSSPSPSPHSSPHLPPSQFSPASATFASASPPLVFKNSLRVRTDAHGCVRKGSSEVTPNEVQTKSIPYNYFIQFNHVVFPKKAKQMRQYDGAGLLAGLFKEASWGRCSAGRMVKGGEERGTVELGFTTHADKSH